MTGKLHRSELYNRIVARSRRFLCQVPVIGYRGYPAVASSQEDLLEYACLWRARQEVSAVNISHFAAGVWSQIKKRCEEEGWA